jgi:hypothetical protein
MSVVLEFLTVADSSSMRGVGPTRSVFEAAAKGLSAEVWLA